LKQFVKLNIKPKQTVWHTEMQQGQLRISTHLCALRSSKSTMLTSAFAHKLYLGDAELEG